MQSGSENFMLRSLGEMCLSGLLCFAESSLSTLEISLFVKYIQLCIFKNVFSNTKIRLSSKLKRTTLKIKWTESDWRVISPYPDTCSEPNQHPLLTTAVLSAEDTRCMFYIAAMPGNFYESYEKTLAKQVVL